MKKNYIKASILTIFVFSMVFVYGYVFAEQTETLVKTITSRVEFAFIEPKVDHEKIDTVFANGILNAKVESIFGDATYADAVLEYKIDSGEVLQVTKEDVSDGSPFYIGTPKGKITKDNSTVDYRIKVLFQSSEGDFSIYAPEGASETDFVTATVISKIEEQIDGAVGGEINVFCGDQSKGDNGTVKVTVPDGAYSGEHKVIVNFIDDSDTPSPSSSINEVKENVISTVSVEVEDVTELNAPIQIENLPLQVQTQANKFVMEYKDGENWEQAQNANLNVDKVNQIFSFAVDNLGYYRVLENIVLTNSSYRPINRIIIKSKIGDRYPGFEFKNLKEGDVVNIYNLKGKKIAKLTSGSDFVWKGKKGTNNSGDWAKSGIYVYQLKHDGKLVSGTIVFVY